MTRRQHIVTGHLLMSSAWNVLASALAMPEFIKRWNEGQWPEFLVVGIHL